MHDTKQLLGEEFSDLFIKLQNAKIKYDWEKPTKVDVNVKLAKKKNENKKNDKKASMLKNSRKNPDEDPMRSERPNYSRVDRTDRLESLGNSANQNPNSRLEMVKNASKNQREKLLEKNNRKKLAFKEFEENKLTVKDLIKKTENEALNPENKSVAKKNELLEKIRTGVIDPSKITIENNGSHGETKAYGIVDQITQKIKNFENEENRKIEGELNNKEKRSRKKFQKLAEPKWPLEKAFSFNIFKPWVIFYIKK